MTRRPTRGTKIAMSSNAANGNAWSTISCQNWKKKYRTFILSDTKTTADTAGVAAVD